ncbi:hypothetical protein ACHAXT_001943 [Thalassiosira profunda]
MEEANGSSSSSSGDLTARNHSRHRNENSECGSSTERPQSPLDDEHSDVKEKPHFQQTLSMDDGVSASSRAVVSSESSLLTWSFYLLLGGIVLGLALPKNPSLPSRIWQWATMSNIVGYTYFLAWSASFYPQIFLNYSRRTTRGLSVDFCVLNVLGYVCYTIYTTNFYWNESVIKEYRERRSGDGEITVQGNDVAFACHAIVMAAVTLSQIGLYDTFVVRPPSKRILYVISGAVTFCILYVFGTWFIREKVDFLGFLYLLGTIKIGVTIGKYVPQALLNRSRKSTVGWNHWNVILDLTGGVLSLVQLVGDCADMRDWTGITGNPAKISLSLVTICFDLIFLVQHYILYPDADDRPFYSPLPGVQSTEMK